MAKIAAPLYNFFWGSRISATPRQIFTEREVVTKMTPIGCLLVYTGDSYAREHNGSEPAEDNLKMEPVTLPNGTQSRGVKAPCQQRCGVGHRTNNNPRTATKNNIDMI